MRLLQFDIAHLLAGGMVILSFLLIYQDRITADLNVFALQAITLALAVAWQAYFQERAAPLRHRGDRAGRQRASSSRPRCTASSGGSRSIARSSR